MKWTKKQLALLGKHTDRKVAMMVGCRQEVVFILRDALGIPPARKWDAPSKWIKRTAKIIKQRKTMTLAAIGKLHGISRARVWQILDRNGMVGRIELPSRARVFTAEEIKLFGTDIDKVIAKKLGCSIPTISVARNVRQIPRYCNRKCDYSEVARMYAAGVKTLEIIERTGCVPSVITRACREHGVPMMRRPRRRRARS